MTSLNSAGFALMEALLSQRERALPTAALAETLGVSERHVRRIVHAWRAVIEAHPGLFAFPAPALEERERRAWVSLAPSATPDSHLFGEAATLIAAQHLVALAPSVLGAAAHAWVMARAGGGTAWAQQIRQTFIYRPFGAKRYDGPRREALAAVVRAALEQRPLLASYVGLDGATSAARRVHPHAVVLYRDGFYVVGYEPKARRFRILAVDRMSSVVVEAGRFERRATFDPARYLNGDFGLWKVEEAATEEVALLFSASAARVAMERAWPGASMWEQDTDGACTLSMRVTITPELIAWILSWGAQVTVLAPASLRERVAATLAEALTRYR